MNEINLKIKSYQHFRESHLFFEDISLSLKSNGEIAYLLGMSGSGKTTLMGLMLNIHKGLFKGECTFTINEKKVELTQLRSKGQIGYMSHYPALIPWKNIKENLELPYRLNENLFQPSEDKIESLLTTMSLEKKVLYQHPNELSFGMQMRISLVRLLLYNPKFIFLDEFFTGVDDINKNILHQLMKNYLKSNDVLCFAITHAIDEAIKVKNDLYVLSNKTRTLSRIKTNITKEHILKSLTL